MRFQNLLIGASGLLAVGALAAPTVASAREARADDRPARPPAAARSLARPASASAEQGTAQANITEVTVDVPGTPDGAFAGCPAGSIAIKADAVELPSKPPPPPGPGIVRISSSSGDDGPDDGPDDGSAVPTVRLGRNEEGTSGAFVFGREGARYRVTLTCLTPGRPAAPEPEDR